MSQGVGSKVFYFSPVNLTRSPAEVVDVHDDGSLDLKLASGYKLNIQVHHEDFPPPWVDLRSQRIPLPYVVFEYDSEVNS